MISPLLDPSRKPPNALRGLRRKMAHFIPSAGAHTKGSYNSSTTAFCAPLKKKKKRRWAPGRLVAEPVAIGSAMRGRLRRSSCFALRRRSAAPHCGGIPRGPSLAKYFKSGSSNVQGPILEVAKSILSKFVRTWHRHCETHLMKRGW